MEFSNLSKSFEMSVAKCVRLLLEGNESILEQVYDHHAGYCKASIDTNQLIPIVSPLGETNSNLAWDGGSC